MVETDLLTKFQDVSRKGCILENFKEVNSDQYNEKGAYTAGFGLRNLIIPGSDTGLNHK